jgi:predicted transcriptional regulator
MSLLSLCARLVLALLLLETVTAVADPSHEPSSTVPMPRLGDRVAYAGVNETTGAQRVEFSFGWTDRASLPDRWGRLMTLDRVVLAWGENRQIRYGFEPGALEAVTMETIGSAARAGGDGGSAPFGGQGASEVRKYLVLEYGPVWWPLLPHEACALRGGWQGRSLEDIPALPPSGFCPGVTWATSLESLGIEDVAGQRALRIQLSGEQNMLTYWISPESPYPIAVKWCGKLLGATCGPEPGRDGVVRYAYDKGDDEPLPFYSPPRRDGVRPLPTAPYTRNGPRDGRNVSFPLDVVLEAVARDASIPAFQEWRKGHPDAALVRASHHHDPDPDLLAPEKEAWSLFWKEPGGETRLLSVTRDGSCGGQPNVLVPSGVTRAAHACDPRVVEVDGAKVDDAPAAARGTTITLAAAEDAFLATASPGVEASYLRFSTGSAQWPATIEVMGEAPTPAALRAPGQGADGETPSEGVVFDARTGEARARMTTLNVKLIPGSPGMLPMPRVSLAPAAQEEDSFAIPGFAARAPALVGATALGLLLLLVLARFVGFLVVLYTRLTRGDILAHPRRAAILAALEETPGLSIPDVHRRLHIGDGTARHHLAVLVRAGAVASVRCGRRRRFFLAGRVQHREIVQSTVAREGGARARVLACIQRRPGIIAAEIAREVGVSRAAVHFALKRMVRDGLVIRRGERRSKGLYPA